MIEASEFDKKFENGENIDEFLDLSSKMTLSDLINDSVTITLSKDLKDKVLELSKKLNLTIEDTIKVLIAKEVGVL